MKHLSKLENQSIFIIREAYYRFKRSAMLWSIGKDSTTLLYLVKKAFLGNIPFPVLHIDTGHKFKEIYKFRDKIAKEWNLDLIVTKNTRVKIEDVKNKLECCTELKTNALKQAVKK